ncbi:phosphate ABC transporter substrate-binding protein PstS [Candidatus Methylospira mobilis]|uniref:Phosphate-binding protein PstS n=1 Tax=Candidatus Methylospira mobilis TaxID=1808979 RepID=A0A5Q0BCQ9_9GAMM|nr:phosphate ABC transporter substrate-binding protein PstS [Candidatus Methylospira mobilis]QFY41299.1 phosphate ABC transporter substrate-binding protein PstS [Candidatus Methylospira mobilis]WNV05479.1 phosphate ABC transporter substrate-binding protein PstS [Candidatus Methylospira mobilis]
MNKLCFMSCLFGVFLNLFPFNPAAAEEKLRLTGSGASFPFPLYSAWFKNYSRDHKDANIDYQAKGSGAGVLDFINRTVDFAASDAAMTPDEIAKVEGGAVLLPMTAGEIVISYNLPGNPQGLKLSRDVYPDIFLGKITRWNDARIQSANAGLKLPDLPITVVRRADSSGTTFVFTHHLGAVSPSWRQGPGAGTTVNWPSSDKIVAAPKNDGVTATIKQTPGAIGYIEYAYAVGARVEMAELQNKAGRFIRPGAESGQATLATAQLPENLIAWVQDPDGEKSYPIATFTWMLFYQRNATPAKAKILRDVVEYGLTEGQKLSTKMGYIPLPENVVSAVRVAARKIQ